MSVQVDGGECLRAVHGERSQATPQGAICGCFIPPSRDALRHVGNAWRAAIVAEMVQCVPRGVPHGPRTAINRARLHARGQHPPLRPANRRPTEQPDGAEGMLTQVRRPHASTPTHLHPTNTSARFGAGSETATLPQRQVVRTRGTRLSCPPAHRGPPRARPIRPNLPPTLAEFGPKLFLPGATSALRVKQQPPGHVRLPRRLLPLQGRRGITQMRNRVFKNCGRAPARSGSDAGFPRSRRTSPASRGASAPVGPRNPHWRSDTPPKC